MFAYSHQPFQSTNWYSSNSACIISIHQLYLIKKRYILKKFQIIFFSIYSVNEWIKHNENPCCRIAITPQQPHINGRSQMMIYTALNRIWLRKILNQNKIAARCSQYCNTDTGLPATIKKRVSRYSTHFERKKKYANCNTQNQNHNKTRQK